MCPYIIPHFWEWKLSEKHSLYHYIRNLHVFEMKVARWPWVQKILEKRNFFSSHPPSLQCTLHNFPSIYILFLNDKHFLVCATSEFYKILVYFHVHFTSNSFDLKVWGGGIVVKCVPGVISHAWWLSTICFVTPYCFLSSGVLRLVTRQLFLAITKATMTTLIGYNSSHDLRVLLLYYMPVMTMIYVEVFWNATSVFIWSQSR